MSVDKLDALEIAGFMRMAAYILEFGSLEGYDQEQVAILAYRSKKYWGVEPNSYTLATPIEDALVPDVTATIELPEAPAVPSPRDLLNTARGGSEADDPSLTATRSL